MGNHYDSAAEKDRKKKALLSIRTRSAHIWDIGNRTLQKGKKKRTNVRKEHPVSFSNVREKKLDYRIDFIITRINIFHVGRLLN